MTERRDFTRKLEGKRVVVAGNLIADHIKTVAFYPEKNLCAPVLALETAVGGAVCNTAIDLKRIAPDLAVFAVGTVGEDADGRFMWETLQKNGVDVSGVTFTDVPTSFSDVMTEKESGERTFFSYKGAGSLFSEAFLPERLQCDLFHIGYLLFLDALDAPDPDFGTAMAKLLSGVQKRGIPTSVDVLSETGNRYVTVVRPALKYTDYCVINETEAGKIAEISPRGEDGALSLASLEKIARKLAACGVSKKVVIHAPEAGVSLDVATGNFTVVPSLTLPAGYIRGAVGAGDAFCAGYLSATLAGEEDEVALAFASAAAACNLAEKDSISGMKCAEEIWKLERFGRKRL